MEPAFRDGDVIYVDRGRPVRAGDDVLVEIDDDTTTVFLVRRLIKIDAQNCTLMQFSPRRRRSIVPIDTVRQIVHVLTINELMGVS